MGGQRAHLGELALGSEAAERGGDGGDGAGEGGGVGVEEEDGAAGGGCELGDPRAHLPRADHAHRRDLTRCRHGSVSEEAVGLIVFGSFRVVTTTLQSSANQQAKTLPMTSVQWCFTTSTVARGSLCGFLSLMEKRNR